MRLPAAIARAAHLHADQRVRITLEGERIIITPIHDVPLSLEQRLARFDPTKHPLKQIVGRTTKEPLCRRGAIRPLD